MKKLFWMMCLVALTAVGLLAPASAQASIIVTWSSVQDISGDINGRNDVATNGTYVDAFYANHSGPPAPTLTVNTVVFNPGVITAVVNGYNQATYNISYSGAAWDYTGTVAAGSGNVMTGAPLANSSVSYQEVLANGIYNYGSAYNGGTGVLTLSHLTLDQKYQIQIWSNVPVQSWASVLSGGPSLSSNVGGYAGQFVIGTFTAASDTFAINVTAGAPGYWFNNISAVSLEAVPEPSGLAMVGLCFAGLLLWRKSRKIASPTI